MTTEPDPLEEILERAHASGFLGPGPVLPHLRHARAFAGVVEDALGRVPTRFADLGTGGGVPGLVLATRWESTPGWLVESNHRRCEALRAALEALGITDRVTVVEARAEAVAREAGLRERLEVVTARGFAEPAVTAEIGSGLVEVGGILVVSEPPDPVESRWSTDRLHELGLSGAERIERDGAHFAVLRKQHPVPERYPRPVGKPSKRPLW